MIENSRYDSSVEMPRVPRSMSRVMPPVWRSRWKRRRQAVQVAEHAERDAPDGALRHAHEHHVAQLREQRGREPQRCRRSRAARPARRRSRAGAVEADRPPPSSPAARRRWRASRRSRQASASNHAPLVFPEVGNAACRRRAIRFLSRFWRCCRAVCAMPRIIPFRRDCCVRRSHDRFKRSFDRNGGTQRHAAPAP